VDGLCQGVVGKRLLDLDRFSGIDELVHVRWHGDYERYRHPRSVSTGSVSWVQVRSAVIPAAGMGTRFLPATKAVPKELMPIGDTPAIQIIIDEALGAGIEHIIVVSSRGKPSIERYFEGDEALVETVRAKGDDQLADRLARIGRDWRVTITYQDNPRGLGHAVGCAREAVGDEPFAVLLPDELMGDSSLLAQMSGVCAGTGGGVVGVKQVARDQVSSYGVVAPSGPADQDGVIPVADLVEKPRADEAPSDYILVGRYVLTPDVFDEIDNLTPGRGGEIQLTDALRSQAAAGPFSAVISRTDRFDTGSPVGFLDAAIAFALRHPEMSDGIRAVLAEHTAT
jgi:UTP--glucose-1-phosphate uridylyltransferase